MLYGCLKDALLPPRSALCSGVVRCVSRCVSRCVPLCPVVCSVVSPSLPLSLSPSLSLSLLLCRGVAVGLLWGCCGSPPFQFLTCPGSAPSPIIQGAFPVSLRLCPSGQILYRLIHFPNSITWPPQHRRERNGWWRMSWGCLMDASGMS